MRLLDTRLVEWLTDYSLVAPPPGDGAAGPGERVDLLLSSEVSHSQPREPQTVESAQQEAYLGEPSSVVREPTSQADAHVDIELEAQPNADHGFDHHNNHPSASSISPEFHEIQDQQESIRQQDQGTKSIAISNDSESPTLHVTLVAQAHVANASTTDLPSQPNAPSNIDASKVRHQREAMSQVASQVESWIESIAEATHGFESPTVSRAPAMPATTFVLDYPSKSISEDADIIIGSC